MRRSKMGRLGLAMLALALFVACRSVVGIPAGAPVVEDTDALAEWGLGGDGNETTELFDMPAGTAIFDSHHSGPGRFTVELLDEAGVLVARLADGTDAIFVSTPVDIASAGKYRLRVVANAPWEISVRQP